MNYGASNLSFSSTVKELSKSVLKNSLKDKEYGTRKRNAKSRCWMCAYCSWLLTIGNSVGYDKFALCSAHVASRAPDSQAQYSPSSWHRMRWHGSVTPINPFRADADLTAMPCLVADVRHLRGSHIMKFRPSMTPIVRIFFFCVVGIKRRAAVSTNCARICLRWLNSHISKAQPTFFLFFSFLFSKKWVYNTVKTNCAKYKGAIIALR